MAGLLLNGSGEFVSMVISTSVEVASQNSMKGS